MKKTNFNKKVLVALSGGIDSAVAAALLKKQGFNVSGAFMIFQRQKDQDVNKCCSPGAQIRARKIAQKLNIPFYVFDLRKDFQKEIINCFIKELKSGRTPNPCVVCNKKIKFGIFLKKALTFGADYLATGHYAKIIQNSKIKNQNDAKKIPLELSENNDPSGKVFKLLKGKDKYKDQSYFLWQLSQEQLSRIIFPLADYTKNEVKKMAERLNLPVLNIPESQEICFIESGLEAFLEKNIKKNWGDILDEKNNLLGKHPGIYFFTIGQRKNIVPCLENKWKSRGPYFVFKKDAKNNILFVTKNKKKLYKKELIAKNINWVFGKTPEMPLKILAKIRYNHSGEKATIKKMIGQKDCKIIFDSLQRAVTPGQSVVFYQKNEVLGGGIIV